MNGLLIACAALLATVIAVGLSLPTLERALCGPGHHRRPARLARPHRRRLPDEPVDYWPAYLPAPAPRRAAGAGQAKDPAQVPAPEADATTTPSGGAATLPQPRAVRPVTASSPGLGQPPAIPLPDGLIACWEDGSYRIRTGELPKIRPYLNAWWEYRDAPARVSA